MWVTVAMAGAMAFVAEAWMVFVVPAVTGDLDEAASLVGPFVFVLAFTFIFALPSAAAAATGIRLWRQARPGRRTPAWLVAASFSASTAVAWSLPIALSWPGEPMAFLVLADLVAGTLHGLATWRATGNAGAGALGGLMALGALFLPSLFIGYSAGLAAVAALAGLCVVAFTGSAVFAATDPPRPPRPAYLDHGL